MALGRMWCLRQIAEAMPTTSPMAPVVRITRTVPRATGIVGHPNCGKDVEYHISKSLKLLRVALKDYLSLATFLFLS